MTPSSRPDDERSLSPGQFEPQRVVASGLVWLEVAGVVWLYYSLLVVCIAVPPFVVQGLGYQLDLRQGTAVTLGCTLVAELAALGLLWFWTRRQALTWSDLGWRRPTTRAALVAALVVALGYSGFTLLLPEVRENSLELSVFKLWGAAVGFVGAAIEEVFFRGFILTKLELRGTKRVLQVLVSGFTFGIVHPGFGWWGMLMTFLLGIALALIYLQGKRSLTGPILCHGLINAIIEPWLLLYTIEIYARMFAS